MKSESQVQEEIMMMMSEREHRLWRNNVGVAMDKRNVPVRYGLCNTSSQQNAKMKSSDLIGIHGQTGQFISIECKKEGWKFNPNNEREVAQKKWIDLINNMGGIAGFISDVSQLRLIL